jgi:hypothetical protein
LSGGGERKASGRDGTSEGEAASAWWLNKPSEACDALEGRVVAEESSARRDTDIEG